jgi:ferredoxin
MTAGTTETASASLDPSSAEVPVGVRVRAHPGLCEGWGNCHRFAPSVYPLDDDGHIGVHLLEVPAELANDAFVGASACPAQAITVIRPEPVRDGEHQKEPS